MRVDRENDLALRHLGVLELKPGASLDDVKQAYRDLARVWHPDRFSDARLVAKAQNRLKDINAAYAWLSKHPGALARAHVPVAPRPVHRPAPARPATRSPGGGPRPAAGAPRPDPPGKEEPATPPPPSTSPRAEPEVAPRQHPPYTLYLALVLSAGIACVSLGLFLATFHFGSPAMPDAKVRSADRTAHDFDGKADARDEDDLVEEEGRAAFDDWFGRLAQKSPHPPPAEPKPARPVRQVARPGKPERPPPGPDWFTVGSSRDAVLNAQGVPTQVTENAWWYGASKVFFDRDRVVGWFAFRSDPLNARMTVPADTVSSGFFTIGSTPDEVLAAQGTPSGLSERVWYYGRSRVYFADGRVVNWVSARDEPLEVRMFPSGPVESKGYFTLGSSKDEVLAAQGTPTEFTADEWRFGLSIVQFRDGRVIAWESSRANPLHARGAPDDRAARVTGETP